MTCIEVLNFQSFNFSSFSNQPVRFDFALYTNTQARLSKNKNMFLKLYPKEFDKAKISFKKCIIHSFTLFTKTGFKYFLIKDELNFIITKLIFVTPYSMSVICITDVNPVKTIPGNILFDSTKALLY